MRLMMILISGLIFSTAVIAVEANENRSPTPKAMQEMSAEEKLNLMNEKIRPHNTVFGNYSNGEMTYEPNK